MSFYTALTGLNGSQADISATSNNIANVATTGYKRSKAEFGDIFATSPLQNASSSIGSGTILKGIKQQFTQGNVTSSLNALDLAISGQGFFALRPSLTTNQTVYTRNGSFSVNNDRFVVDSAGQYVLALPVSNDGSVQGGEISDAAPLKLELEAGEAKATKNLALSVNLPASSTVYESPDDFDPSNPETYNSSTSVTIFDNLGNPVIATAYFIKTQAASGDNVTHKYQTKFIVDGREVEPSLTEAISPTGQTLVVDRFGQIIPIDEKPQIISVAQTQPLFYLDDLANKTVSKAATVTNEVLEDAAFTTTAPSITIVTDPLQYNTTYDDNPTLNKSTYWGKDFLTIRVDDTTGSAAYKSIDIRPGTYTAASLAQEVQRAINSGLGDDSKLSIDPVTDGNFSIQFNQLDNNDELQTLSAINVDLMKDSFVTEDLFSATSGVENVASPNFKREEFLAHSQLRINDALNRAAVSADGATNNSSTYGVSSALFARGTGLKLSSVIEETEVLSFKYKQPATDLTNENAVTDETKFLLHSYYNASPTLKVFESSLDVKAVSGNTMVQDASGTLKVYINDPNDSISSTSFPTEVHLAGEFDTTTSTVNNLKYNGAQFSVSSAGTDANGNKFLNLKSDSTAAINITDTKIKVLHTVSKDVDAYFEGGTGIFDNQTAHFGSKRIVLKELNKHAYLNNNVSQPDTLLNGNLANSASGGSAVINVDTTEGFPSAGTLLVGSELIEYASKTSTTFVGLTRGVDSSLADFSAASNHLDDATIKLFDFTDGIFSKFKDKLRNTTSTDTTALTNSQTTVTVDSTAGFPDTGTLLIGDERISYTGKTDTTFTGLGRGADNTNAAAAAASTLGATITDSQTSITVASTAGFSDTGSVIINSEIMTYTGKTATTFTGLTRGAFGTTAAAVGSLGGGVDVKQAVEISLVESVETLGLDRRTTQVNDSSNITAEATTIAVDSTDGFEDSGFLLINDELIQYTGKTSTSFTGLTRGAGGTTKATHLDDADIFQTITITDDWVDEKDPALKIAYDSSGQNFTLQGVPSKIGTSTSSKMFSFSAYAPGEGTGSNAIGLKTLANKATANIGGGAVLKAESIVFNGDQIAADTQRAYGVEVSYNNLTRKFDISSGSTGEDIPANSAVGVGDSGQAASNIEIGRLAIVDGLATAATAGTGGTNALLGINATSAVSVAAGDTAGKGLQSTAATLNGKTSNEDLSEDFFLSSAAEETIFVVNVNDITAAIKVPEGVYNGTQLATALQQRINQMEDSTGNTVNGVTVVYNTTSNSFSFTTGTTGTKSKIFVSGSARLGLDNLELQTGSTPSFVNMSNATAQSATGQSLYVNDDGDTTTLAPDSSWTPTTNGTFAKVYLRPGELTFDTQGNLVSPIQQVGYKGDFAANADLDQSSLSIDLDLNFNGSTQFASDFNVKSVTQDGQTVGKLDGLDVASNGLVSANYTNGLNIALGRLVTVNFNNQNGLKQIGNATYVETSVSGVANVGEAGADGYGTILSGSLERSNVDITEELVNLITAQRNFQANAKTIETNTTLTQAIIQIRA